MILSKEQSKKSANQMAQWYLDQAMTFEKSQTQQARESKVLAWRCFFMSMALTTITIITSAVLIFVNKPNPPVVMRVNELSGEVMMLKTLSDEKISYGEATDIAYLRRYVEYRESYDWETIQDLYNSTLLLSNKQEGRIYAEFNGVQNKLSPVNTLKDRARVLAKAGTIAFVGKTALVSFSKTLKPLNGQPSSVEYYVATIAYEYTNNSMSDQDRGINPAGFTVTSYRVDRDISKRVAFDSKGTLN